MLLKPKCVIYLENKVKDTPDRNTHIQHTHQNKEHHT